MQLSIVIPTLNEADYLEQAIVCVRKHAWRGAPEIIVSDCGSRDETLAVALRLGVHVVRGMAHVDSKAAALNQGAALAGGNVLLFLDADSFVPPGYDAGIARALAKPGVVGGAFQFALAGPQSCLRIVEVVNRIRYRLWPRYYGDQGLFVRADVFRRAGAFPKRRLMETAVFSGRLARFGRLVLVNKYMKTSPRRFINCGILRVLLFDSWLWWLDWLG